VLLAQRQPALGVGGHLFGWLEVDFHAIRWLTIARK
jgi:hypothetical protein